MTENGSSCHADTLQRLTGFNFNMVLVYFDIFGTPPNCTYVRSFCTSESEMLHSFIDTMLFSTGGMRNVSALEREVGSSMPFFVIFWLFSFLCLRIQKSWNLSISLRNQMFAAQFQSCMTLRAEGGQISSSTRVEAWAAWAHSCGVNENKFNLQIYRTDVSNVPILDSQKRFGCGIIFHTGCRSNAIWKIVSGVRQAEVGMSPAASRDVILRHRIDSPYVMTSKEWKWSI